MKIIFESGDLVRRGIFCKVGETEHRLFGGALAHFVGRKTDKDNIYTDVVVFTRDKEDRLLAARWDALDCTGGLDFLTKSYKQDGKRHPEWILTDEVPLSVADKRDYISAQGLQLREGNIKFEELPL